MCDEEAWRVSTALFLFFRSTGNFSGDKRRTRFFFLLQSVFSFHLGASSTDESPVSFSPSSLQHITTGAGEREREDADLIIVEALKVLIREKKEIHNKAVQAVVRRVQRVSGRTEPLSQKQKKKRKEV